MAFFVAPALPAIGKAVGWTVGLAVGTAAGTVISSQVSATISPSIRATTYAANWETPNLKLDIGDYVSLYHAGSIDAFELRERMRHLGINANATDWIGGDGTDWKSLVDLKTPIIDLGTAIDMRNQGFINDADLDFVLNRHGMFPSRPTDFQARVRNAARGAFQPYPLEKIIEQNKMGNLAGPKARQHLTRLGYSKTADQDFWLNQDSPFDQTIISAMYHRRPDLRFALGFHMEAIGFVSQAAKDTFISATHGIPGSSDLIRFAVREAWNEDVVRTFGYDEEFPDRFAYWMKTQGFEYKPKDIFPDYPFADELTWSKAFWRAHWDVMSPTMGYEALHRLRGVPGQPQTYRVHGVRPFTRQNMSDILKIADYPPSMREWLIATSYRVIGRIDLRRIYATGVFGPPGGPQAAQFDREGNPVAVAPAEREVWEAFQDQGYNARDSAILTLWLATDAERSISLRGRNRLVKSLVDAYKTGARGKVVLLLDLVRAGLTDQQARATVDQAELEFNVSVAKETVATLRQAFLNGVIDQNQVRRELLAVGYDMSRVTSLIQRWTIRRAIQPKEPAARQLCEWRGAGLITDGEMRRRLANLGWRPEDVERILRHCVMGHLAKTGKEQDRRVKAQVRDAERLARIAEKRQREGRQVDLRDVRTFLATRPDKYLLAWIKGNVITMPEVVRTLRLRGMLPVDIARWLKEPGGYSDEQIRTGVAGTQPDDGAAPADSADVPNS